MPIARLFPGLWLRLTKLSLACAALMLSAPTNSVAEDVPLQMAEIHFGRTTVMLDRELVLGVVGVAKSLLGTKREFNIPTNSTVQVALPHGCSPPSVLLVKQYQAFL